MIQLNFSFYSPMIAIKTIERQLFVFPSFSGYKEFLNFRCTQI